MEEVGIKPKRVAGASAGAIASLLVALGYNPQQIYACFQQDMSSLLSDAKGGLCCLLPNMLSRFGWHPADGFMGWLGGVVSKQMNGNPDATFKDVMDEKKIELCITAVNVNMLSVEYFHPKTTPNMPVRLAVRMSMAIPGVFQPKLLDNNLGGKDIYVDGGTLCNYPLHAFDGWWLSMKPQDSFLNKIKSLNDLHKMMDQRERFGKSNDKTLGFLVYSSMEQEIMQMQLDSRVGMEISERPENSHLWQQRKMEHEEKHKLLGKHKVFIDAFDAFMKILQSLNKENIQGANDIDRSELIEAIELALSKNNHLVPESESSCASSDSAGSLDGVTNGTTPVEFIDGTCPEEDESSKTPLNEAQMKILFGSHDPKMIFDKLDLNKNGKIEFRELLQYVERQGINIQSKFHGFQRRDINSLSGFFEGLQECFVTQSKRVYIQKEDINRTVGINTDYVGTLDFDLTDADRDFCVEQGRRATIAFLRHYVDDKKLRKRKPLLPVVKEPQRTLDQLGDLKLKLPELPHTFKSNNGVLPPIGSAPTADGARAAYKGTALSDSTPSKDQNIKSLVDQG